jgi:GNAT superfamily N-acetyltransferase
MEAAGSAVRLRRITDADERVLAGLADVLLDCVEGGASVGFMHPLSRERAIAFWRDVAATVAAGERVLFIAEDADGICGTVQLILAQPENQPHRADVAKMQVHRRARRRGVGAALMRAAETAAAECGKTLLVLDTASADAERLYERMGWRSVGVVPDYALLPRGGFCATRFYYRRLVP